MAFAFFGKAELDFVSGITLPNGTGKKYKIKAKIVEIEEIKQEASF